MKAAHQGRTFLVKHLGEDQTAGLAYLFVCIYGHPLENIGQRSRHCSALAVLQALYSLLFMYFREKRQQKKRCICTKREPPNRMAAKCVGKCLHTDCIPGIPWLRASAKWLNVLVLELTRKNVFLLFCTLTFCKGLRGVCRNDDHDSEN